MKSIDKNGYVRPGEYRNCITCGSKFWALKQNIKRGGGKFCGHSCQRGKYNPFWSGGRTKHKRGYWLVLNPKHPYCNNRGYIYEHRIVMENYIGRYLKNDEVVHHVNGDRSDNRIENLKLFNNHSNHLKHEWEMGTYENR